MVMLYIFRMHLASLNKRQDEVENTEGSVENSKKGYRYLL
jgi:hypothetical protein